MDWLIPIFGLVSLSAYAAWSLAWARRNTPARHTAIPIFIAFICMAGYAALTMLGTSRPVWMTPSALVGAKLIGYKLVEKRAIYLFVQPKGGAEPRLFVLPWSDKTAEALEGAERQAREQRTGVTLRRPPSEGTDSERRTEPYADPPDGYPTRK